MRDFVQRIIFSRVTVLATGGVIAAVLLWFLSPLIGGSTPLGAGVTRALAAAFVPAIMGIAAALNQWRQRRENARMAEAVSEPGGAAAGSQEVNALSNRLREALDTLKKSRFGKAAGRRWLYQLPWYVLIGPPGSGKTTALVNSGLNFPLSEKYGRRGIGGVGGTRSCDWWFTDEAVLIDTAGRYTAQDSDPGADKAAWLGFLRLLKKYRRRQPLNGVLVVIGADALISSSDAERQEHAYRIRQRVAEIYAELGVRLPVYVLFTKADLIAGFVEFFDDLGREGREAVWGLTFGYTEPEPKEGALPQYGQEFDALIGRLNERLLERLQQEADLERRALMFGFPQQVASLKELSERFLQEAFQANAFEQQVLLRGVYFASGTQAGTPFDRVLKSMSAMFGTEADAVSGTTANPRSFFLNRLLREVVFGEAALVDADPRAERRRRRLALATRIAAATAVLGGSALFGASFLANRRLVGQVEAATADFTTRAGTLQLDRVDDPDLHKVVPLLNQLRDLPVGATGRRDLGVLVTSVGLSQAGKLGSQGAAAYHRALGALLLPRLILRLENQIAQHLDDADFLGEALKVYLMLGRQGPLDRDLVTRWMTVDWQTAYPGESEAVLREDLAGHLHALLAATFPGIVLNGDLVKRARDTLQSVPAAQRVYAAIAASPAARALPEWRVANAAGPAAGTVFVRRSGQPLTAGIPGFFTAVGFRDVFLPALPAAVRDAVRQDWVLGTAAPGSGGDVTPVTLERDVASLYLQDFAQRWDRLIGDLSIVRVTDLQGALRVLNVLSSPSSPIRLLVVAAANETRLSTPPPGNLAPSGASPGASPGTASPGTASATDQARLQRLLGVPANDPASPGGIAAAFTDQHFQELHWLTAVPPNSAPNAPLPIDDTVADLGRLYRSISDAAESPSPLQGGAEASATDRIQAGAARLPQPVQGWVLGVMRSSASMSLGDARERLVALWRSTVGAACQAATQDRYPFQPAAAQDVSLGDFARLFGRGGLFDSFFNDNLRAHVDTSRHPWRWRMAGAVELGLGAEPLRAFEAAAAIRDSYFVVATPSVGFTLTPTALEGDAASVTLTMDGQAVSYGRGVATSVRLQWPGFSGSTGAKVAFASQRGSASAEIATTGPWGWFHLLDRGQLRGLGRPNRLAVSFVSGENRAAFEMEVESPANPFASNPATQFRCPWPQ
jgi:type VI secretion system protein ImpL